MLRGSKEYLLKYIQNKTLRNKISRYKSDDLVVDVSTYLAFKTKSQNNLFHLALQIFEDSSCHSFENYRELRLHYKNIAGLLVMVKGVVVEESWANVTKDNARITINQLLHDMDEAQVISSSQSKKYEYLLRQIGEWFEC